MDNIELITGYLTNPEEIVELCDRHRSKFTLRAEGEKYNFSTPYGNSNMKSMFYYDMPEELRAAIFKTLPKQDLTADSYVINRYDPGDFLPRHKDSQGAYWKFKLIFLQSDAPHFAYYVNDQMHLVNEVPGALLKFPIDMDHEVTKIDDWERPKYSLVLAWGK